MPSVVEVAVGEVDLHGGHVRSRDLPPEEEDIEVSKGRSQAEVVADNPTNSVGKNLLEFDVTFGSGTVII
jgi:hypothetical protein